MKKKLNDTAVQVSIVVCTYNRPRQLDTALAHLRKAAESTPLSAEVIIVDNNSADDTRAVIESASQDFPVPLRYALEPNRGLAFARNRGIREASGAVIGFTDDDCIVDERWITALWTEFLAYPDVGVLGGRVDLYNTEDAPVTIRPLTERVRYSNATQIYGLIVGCNMALRREVTDKIGMFDPAFGTRGVTADDVEYVYRALRSGLGVLYTPEPRVFHNHGRRTPEEIQNVGVSYLKGRGAFYCKYVLKADPSIVRHAWWELRALIGKQPPGPYVLSPRQTFRALLQGALHFVRMRTFP